MASLKSAFSGKCPKCHKGSIFAARGNVFLLRMPEMHPECPECGYRFEKEPGYFLGAMYVSYAMGIVEMMLAFAAFYAHVPLTFFFVLLFTVLLLTSLFNFRVARIVWIHLFPY